jgi:6-phosphogluconate dehydrogenase
MSTLLSLSLTLSLDPPALPWLSQEGDIIVDGGNEWFPNSIRRSEMLQTKGIHFIGMGISGGEEGARNGPSLMPGGPRAAFDLLEPIFTKCAAQVDDGPCTTYVGPIGAGNYVKMVHNGIEYGDMQLIAEIYDILKHAAGLNNEEISQVLSLLPFALSPFLSSLSSLCLSLPPSLCLSLSLSLSFSLCLSL